MSQYPIAVLIGSQTKEGLFDDAGSVGANTKPFLQGWMDRYVAWVKAHAEQTA